ncbi:hypothetical protein CTA2_427 [Colletotrichum tanaceti]|nr:hypothetical protein CTA2_427 [Colletotrichum tanaceti]
MSYSEHGGWVFEQLYSPSGRGNYCQLVGCPMAADVGTSREQSRRIGSSHGINRLEKCFVAFLLALSGLLGLRYVLDPLIAISATRVRNGNKLSKPHFRNKMQRLPTIQ